MTRVGRGPPHFSPLPRLGSESRRHKPGFAGHCRIVACRAPVHSRSFHAGYAEIHGPVSVIAEPFSSDDGFVRHHDLFLSQFSLAELDPGCLLDR